MAKTTALSKLFTGIDACVLKREMTDEEIHEQVFVYLAKLRASLKPAPIIWPDAHALWCTYLNGLCNCGFAKRAADLSIKEAV